MKRRVVRIAPAKAKPDREALFSIVERYHFGRKWGRARAMARLAAQALGEPRAD